MTDQEMNDPALGYGERGVETNSTQSQAASDQPQNDYASNGGESQKKKRVSSLTDLPRVREYLNRVGATATSLRRAVIREDLGAYWRDHATIRFDKDGTVRADEGLEPTEAEAEAIKAAFAEAQWPQVLPIRELTGLPDALKNERSENLFEFRERVPGGDGATQIVMVQQRVEDEEGDKNYLPWTYWDDHRWRCCEPEGDLPLYNGDRLTEAKTVFIHEGAKGARYCQWMVDGQTREAREALAAHPWGRELNNGVHVGWIGGAANPHRTDWTQLAKAGATRVYVVADNDHLGTEAVPLITRNLAMQCWQVTFTDEFEGGFDLGDAFPSEMWREGNDGKIKYRGPSFSNCISPATWATKYVKNPHGKPSVRLRHEFAQDWYKVVDPPVYAHRKAPHRLYSTHSFDRAVRPFSDTNETSKLLNPYQPAHIDGIDYRPDMTEGTFASDKGKMLNIYRPSRIEARKESADKWLEFLKYLLPDQNDRYETERWLATLIAKPEVKMHYSLLLISEKQGVGKSTLAEKVLKPLVGDHNTSSPDAQTVVHSDFNGWKAYVRLVIIDELYQGNDDKAYNALKKTVTDPTVEINKKFVSPHEVTNWVHVVASSNSFRALRMREEDRRWLIPEVTETTKDREWFKDFNEWLLSGGLEAIKHWAENFDGDYVLTGDHAPITNNKRKIIDETMTPGQKLAKDLGEALAEGVHPDDRGKPEEDQRKVRMVLTEREVVEWVKGQRSDGVGRMEGNDVLRSALAAVKGVRVCRHEERPKVAKSKQYVFTNFDLPNEWYTNEGAWSWKKLGHPENAKRVEPGELIDADM